DKVVLFVEVADHGTDAQISARHSEMAELSYLGGHTLGELLNTERRATAEALRLAGKPHATLYVPRIGAEQLGQIFMLFQIATVYAGALCGVNPLDQPGVELSKRLTYGLMGRTGVPRPDLREADPRWR